MVLFPHIDLRALVRVLVLISTYTYENRSTVDDHPVRCLPLCARYATLAVRSTCLRPDLGNTYDSMWLGLVLLVSSGMIGRPT